MNRGGNDQSYCDGYSGQQGRNRNISVFTDLFPDIERKHSADNAKRGCEKQQSHAGKKNSIDQRAEVDIFHFLPQCTLSAETMSNGYPAARVTAEAVHPHLLQHFELRSPAETFGALPEIEDIAALIDTAFWASLLREELAIPKVSLTWLQSDVNGALCFESALPFNPPTVSRVAPAVERPGLHLGVWRDPGSKEYVIWGIKRMLPPLSLVVEVVAPGLIVVKHSRRERSIKFANLAVLEGNRIRLLDHNAPIAPSCPSELLSMVQFDTAEEKTDRVASLLVEIASSMRQHNRGGLLLIVPSGNPSWRDSIVQPVTYGISPPYSKLAYLLQKDPVHRDAEQWRRAVDQTIQSIAGLTAVDGATIINERYDVLAFGAKIGRRQGATRVHEILVSEPVVGNKPAILHSSQIGGTRHLSAAQFVHDQKDSIALVASQDGRFTVFSWSRCDEVVQAHYLETMLL